MLRNSRDRYGSLSSTLHWLMLLLIAAVYACIELPPLIGPDEARAESLEELHKTVGTIGYWLIGLHAAAALFHHYVQRDNTLTRMLPLRRARV